MASVSECSARGRGFSRHRGLPVPCSRLRSADGMPRRPVHRLDEPTGAIPWLRGHSAASVSPGKTILATTSAANFRMRRDPIGAENRRGQVNDNPFKWRRTAVD